MKIDHTAVEYVPFRKDFYVEVPEIANMTKEEVDAYRWEVPITDLMLLLIGFEVRKDYYAGFVSESNIQIVVLQSVTQLQLLQVLSVFVISSATAFLV